MRSSFLSRITAPFRKRHYEGGAPSRRWRGIPVTPDQAQAAVVARAPTAQRARFVGINAPLGRSALEGWANALVGSGIKSTSAAADEAMRGQINAQFEVWTDHADADGTLDWYGLQLLAAQRLVVDGEAFALLINRPEGLRVRLIDPELVDSSITKDLADGGVIIQGIELDAQGRRRAYHIRQPSLTMTASATLKTVRVDAADVVHLYRKDVAGQQRGISWLSPVLQRLVDMDMWRDAELARQKFSSALVCVITRKQGGDGVPNLGEMSQTPDHSALEGGIRTGTYVVIDDNNYESNFSNPAQIGSETIDFARSLEREIAAGVGMPVHILTGNLENVNYSSIRAGLIEFRQRVEAYQYHLLVRQLLRPVWERWIATEVLAGRIRGTVDAALPVRWTPPKLAWIDPLKDAQSEAEAIAAGLMSRTQAIAARGDDAERLDAEIAADKAREKRLGLDFSAKPTPAANTNLPAAIAA